MMIVEEIVWEYVLVALELVQLVVLELALMIALEDVLMIVPQIVPMIVQMYVIIIVMILVVVLVVIFVPMIAPRGVCQIVLIAVLIRDVKQLVAEGVELVVIEDVL